MLGRRDKSLWARLDSDFAFVSQSVAAIALVSCAAVMTRGALGDVWAYPAAPALLYGGAALAGYAVARLPMRILVVSILLSACYVSASWAWTCLFAQSMGDLVGGILSPLAVLAAAGMGIFAHAASHPAAR